MQSVDDWLEGLNLQAFTSLFRDNSIDMQSLPLLTENDLKDIGLPLGPRKIVTAAIEKLRVMPRGERRFLTTVFGDLVGSTEMARRLDPEDYESVLRKLRTESLRVISELGGFVADFAGDSVVAYFGWPEAFETQADQALRSALNLRDSMMDELIRVGISSGEVFVGSVQIGGTHERMVATGEAPNRASRLQGVADPGAILVDDATRRLVGNQFSFGPKAWAQVKGFDTPLTYWQLKSEEEVNQTAVRALPAHPMVERDRELDALITAWRSTGRGQGGYISISGDAGCGKSRLVAGFLDKTKITDSSSIHINCAPQNEFSTFLPVLNGLRSFLVNSTFDGEVPQILHDLLDGTLEKMIDISAQERRREVIQACVSFMTGQGADKPILVLVEDLHWIDPSSFELLQQLATPNNLSRLLLVTTERAQHGAERLADVAGETIRLGRLSDAALSELIRSIAGANLSEEALVYIIERADGIPLFAEQLALAALEGASDSGKLSVPASLRATLVSRLDRLGESKTVALSASVIGRRFSREALAHVSELTNNEIETGLQALLSVGLIQQDGSGFLFSHALVRDAAYSGLLRDNRRSMHRRMAAWLQQQQETAFEVEAQHLQEAGDHRMAAKKWELAANAARSRFAQVEAAELYSRALEQDEIATGGERALDLLMHLGAAQFAALGGSAEVTQVTFQDAITLAEERGSTWEQCSALYGVWVGKMIMGSYDEAMECARQMFAIADKTGDPCIRIAALRIRSAPVGLSGDLNRAIADAEEALSIASTQDTSRFGDFAHDPLATLLPTYAQALWARGEPENALEIAHQAVRNCVSSRQTVNTISYVRTWEIILLAQSRKPRRLAAAAHELQRFGERTGGAFWENLGTWGQSYAKILQGEHSAATPIAQASVDRFMSTGARQQAPLFLLSVAEGKLASSQHSDAHILIDRAEKVIRETKQGYFQPLLLRTKSVLLKSMGDIGAARELRNQLMEATRKSGAITWIEAN